MTLAGISPIIFSTMKSKHLLLLLAGLALCPGCRPRRPALVPEISAPLVQEEVCAWTGNMAAGIIFPCAGGIGWVDAAGRIIAFDSKKKNAAAVFAVPFAVTEPPFVQGHFLVLQNKSSDRLLVYDLAAGHMTFESSQLGVTQILGVDSDAMVYLAGGRLTVNLWSRPGAVYRDEERAAQFFNCHFFPERILILTPDVLHVFWKKSGRFESLRLPQPAMSPFLYDNGYIYYGSSERCLVKYSLAKKRPAWKVKLGQSLWRQPLAFAGSIVVAASDHNFLQVNGKGSLLWWQALRSTMSHDLLPMSENLAAVLMNREIKFIDPRHRQVTVFKDAVRPHGPPLAFGGDLYYMAHDEGQAYRLLRVGNRYGVEIELEPGRVHWAGTSLRFSVRTQHLLAPLWECEIVDAQGQPVFISNMAGTEKASLLWVPLQAGKYIIRVRAKALNRDALGEVPLQVLDPQQVIPGFYLHF